MTLVGAGDADELGLADRLSETDDDGDRVADTLDDGLTDDDGDTLRDTLALGLKLAEGDGLVDALALDDGLTDALGDVDALPAVDSCSATNRPAESPEIDNDGLLVSPVLVLIRNSPRRSTAAGLLRERASVIAVKLDETVMSVVPLASLPRPR